MRRCLACLWPWLVGGWALVALLVWADEGRVRPGPATAPARPTGTHLYTTTVVIPSYPYTSCLSAPQTGVAGVRFRTLDWDCLATAGPPVSQTFTRLVLENDFVTISLLPELGGRVYEMVFKPTGHNLLYRNPVLKPTHWGPPEQGWWLAVGGLEWCFPTDEHGYEWGVPWPYQIVSSTAGVTVTLYDSQALTRPTVSVAVHLPADRAALVVRPRLVNPTGEPVAVKYWTNGMLAPGPHNTPSADLRFLFPGDQVTVHSTGDPTLPPAGDPMPWPVYAGRDLSRLGEWRQWLGFFEAPQAHGPFAGVYDVEADEGIVRLYPADVARGSKGFAFGWADPLPSEWWTDDGSAYVEVHGGLAPTFWDTVTLSPGQVVSWTEVWYPVAGLGGVSTATEQAALRLAPTEEGAVVGLYTPAVHQGVALHLWRADCSPLYRWEVKQVGPGMPFVRRVEVGPLTAEELRLAAVSQDGTPLGGVNLADCLPPTATVETLPLFVTTTTVSVTWRGQDVWSGVASYDVQVRDGYEGEWTDWLTRTSAAGAIFDGQDGHTYFFRARARDVAGNTGVWGDEEWGQAFTSVLLTPAPVLATTRKQAEPSAPRLGQGVRYSVWVSNTGNLTAAVTLTDRLPATLALVSGTVQKGGGSLWLGEIVAWEGEVPPGSEVRLAYVLTATESTPTGAPLTNTLTVVREGGEPLVRRAVVTYWQRLYLPLVQKGF